MRPLERRALAGSERLLVQVPAALPPHLLDAPAIDGRPVSMLSLLPVELALA